MHIVIFSGGQVEDGFFVQEALKDADLIIAADSGAESALQFGVTPNILVGDFDSISKEILNNVILGTNVVRTPESVKNGFWTRFACQNDGREKLEVIQSVAEKDETDTQLAIDIAIQKGATEISILGGVVGNRLDHVLGNVFLSGYPTSVILNGNEGSSQKDSEFMIQDLRKEDSSPLAQNDKKKDSGQARLDSAKQARMTFINGNQKTWIETGPHSASSGQATEVHIFGKKGDLLSLIPLSEKVENITTENLQYPLKNETLFFGIPRGISNVFLKELCSVSFTRGKLLLVQTKKDQ